MVVEWERWPTRAQQCRFLQDYFAARFGDHPAACRAALSNLEEHLGSIAEYASLVSLLWGFWGVLQLRSSTIAYDYERYSRGRFLAFTEGVERQTREKAARAAPAATTTAAPHASTAAPHASTTTTGE
jgi:hypothetical protein